MIILHHLGFIPHPNTGTRSIREALFGLGAEYAGRYHEVCPEAVKRCRDVACTIRNPWDQMVSWWYKTGNYKDRSFSEWLRLVLWGDRDYEGGHKLFYGYEDSSLVMRFEDLQNTFDQVMGIAGFPTVKLRHIGKTETRTPGYRSHYDLETKWLVERVYGEQIEWGKYQF